MDSFVTGVLDGDPKGTTGIGTIFFVDVTLDEVTTRHTWGLIEEIQGKFNFDSVVHLVRERLKAASDKVKAAEVHTKKVLSEQREAGVVVNDTLANLVKAVLAENEPVVAEFKSGKDKALHSLVGRVIKQIKVQQLTVDFDAFTINRAIQQQLGHQ